MLAYSDSAMSSCKRFGKKATDLIQETGIRCIPSSTWRTRSGSSSSRSRTCGERATRCCAIGKSYYLNGLLGATEAGPPAEAQAGVHGRGAISGSCLMVRFRSASSIRSASATSCINRSTRCGTARRIREPRQWVDNCPGCWAECEGHAERGSSTG